MAITIQAAAPAYSPDYNPIWWVVSSTNTAQANFEYICDIYITGVTFAGGAAYLRLKAPADPTYGRGVFDISKILQRELTSDLSDAIFGFQQCSNSILSYDIKFGELYGPSSGIVAYPNLTSQLTQIAFNGSLGTLERKDYTSTDYVADTSVTQINLLSNAPSSGTIRTNENAWIYAMSQTSGAIKYANIITYTDARWTTQDKVYRVINHAYHSMLATQIGNKMIRFPVGWNMNSIPNSSISINQQSILSVVNTPKSWQIYFTDTDKNRITKSFFFTVDDKCTAHTVYRIHFKNKWGAYDSFSFIRASQKSADIKRNKYEKVIGNFKSGSSYTYNKTDRFETNFYTEYKHTIKLHSDWINENQSVWLEELLTSPEIYVDDVTSGLLPINITDTKYIQRQHLTDKIFNLEINIQYTFNEIRQGA